MTSDRPYSKARSVEEAAAEMERCSGTQVDPSVVEALSADLGLWPLRKSWMSFAEPFRF